MPDKISHQQALADFDELYSIAKGFPHDGGEYLEVIADDMLRKPNKKQALHHLSKLVADYFSHGDPSGESLRDNPNAHAIFVRHGLVDDDGDTGNQLE